MPRIRLTLALAALFIAFFRAFDASVAAEFDVGSWSDDGYPLLRQKDASALDAIWSALASDPDVSKPFGDALWFQLSRKGQRKASRGKTLTVKGRLLRAVFVQTTPPDAEKVDGYYDLWVLPPDSKRSPLRVIAKRAPVGFKPDDKLENETPYAPDVKYRNEKFLAVAVYYRATAYYAGDDFYTVPTLVALDFQATSATAKPTPPQSGKNARRLRKTALVVALVLLWFLARRAFKRISRTAKKPNTTTSPLLLAAILTVATNAFAEDKNDVAFQALAVGLSEKDWTREIGGVRPNLADETLDEDVANRRSAALTALGKLSGLLSISVLKELGDDAFRQTTLGEYFLQKERANFASRPLVGYFAGVPRSFDAIDLNETEKERTGFKRLYRVKLGSGPAETIVYAPDAPDLTNLERFAPFFDRTPIVSEYGGYGVFFGVESENGAETPVVLSPKLGFRSDASPLCRAAGLDLGAFRSFRVYPIKTLETERDASRRRIVARALRWTTDDREPFYETLAAVKRLNLRDDPREPIVDVVPLFNAPEKLQGAKAKISGWARRVNMILVDDPDVRVATGIDRYYQLYVYTDDSQGWPLVLCVPELPDALPCGGGSNYRRVVDFTGYFYKTWAYKNSEKHDVNSDETPTSSWTRAPVLIGKITKAYPEDPPAPSPPFSASTLLTVFAVLACAWIVLRRLATRPPNYFSRCSR